MRSEGLITYCGVYAGTCARWREYTVFRDLSAIFVEWVDAQGYQYWMPAEVKEFNYTEFRKALDFFSKKDTSYIDQQDGEKLFSRYVLATLRCGWR